MQAPEFVAAIKKQASDAAVSGTQQLLTKPPGRKPSEKLLELSRWYHRLSTSDQEMLKRVLKETAEMAVFEFFCALDGVSAIEDGADKGQLELYFVKDTERTRLNDPKG